MLIYRLWLSFVHVRRTLGKQDDLIEKYKNYKYLFDNQLKWMEKTSQVAQVRNETIIKLESDIKQQEKEYSTTLKAYKMENKRLLAMRYFMQQLFEELADSYYDDNKEYIENEAILNEIDQFLMKQTLYQQTCKKTYQLMTANYETHKIKHKNSSNNDLVQRKVVSQMVNAKNEMVESNKQMIATIDEQLNQMREGKKEQPVLDRMFEYINKENVIVAMIVGWMSFVFTFFYNFVGLVGSDEFECNSLDIVMQLFILMLFLVYLVKFKYKHISWNTWISLVIKNKHDLKKIVEYPKFSQQKEQKWYNIILNNKRKIAKSVVFYLLFFLLIGNSLVKCAVGTQATHGITICILLFFMLYYLNAIFVQSTNQDSKSVMNMLEEYNRYDSQSKEDENNQEKKNENLQIDFAD